MSDGRLLVRSGQSFLIMDSDELIRTDRWLIVSVAIDAICVVAIILALVLSVQGSISEEELWKVIYASGGILTLSAVTIGLILVVSIGKRTQPTADRDRLEEVWDQASDRA